MNDSETIDPEELPVTKSHLRFPVVGIGASAGGVNAVQQLLGQMPAAPGMAFVVVMHLSPDFESSLGSILQKAGKLPVTTVKASTPIEVNHVYVISPSLKLMMSDGHLRVSPLETLEARRTSIDLFFRSLAHAHEERAVCIVLSGTGSDGAQGLRRLKELGGLAMAQSPEDAEFDGMPRAAIQTGQVDFVLPAADMAAKLGTLWDNARRIELPNPPTGLDVEPSANGAEILAEEALVSIKALLRERTGHDFAHYKRGTVMRRLERRMQVNAVQDLPSYRRLLDSEPDETLALLQDMLISVTNFFRDPQAFGVLEAAIKGMVADRPTAEPFRAWVAGCATGEEAYSIAIVLREMLGSGVVIQVFASDIDQRAVASARTGTFPSSIATDVSDRRVRKFFVSSAQGLRITKEIRDSVVFSAHNVLSDPPFTRMDLICCRNLLIYLDRRAQSQVLKSFHFSMKPQGLLFLGSSETADAAEELFDAVDKSHRIYRASQRAPRSRSLPTMAFRVPTIAPPVDPSIVLSPPKSHLELLHERVVRNYAPPTVLHVSDRASHLLRFPAGTPTNKLLALARPELRAELRAAKIRAAETGRTVEAPRVRLSVNGQPRSVIITVRPAAGESPPGLMLVVFDEAEESMADMAQERQRDPIVESLEAELIRTQEHLRNTVGESTASTEELRASNEELQTINEELRSTTEELETSREELQAVNEELVTVNTELTQRMDDAGKLSDDLQNLMNSADIGSIFVSRDMHIKRFTPQAATLFNLLPSDLGRPLLDITHRLDYDELSDDVASVLRDLRRIEREVRSHDGRWFLARVVPYRTSDDRIEGAVLAFFNITARLAAEAELRLVEQKMRVVAESMRDFAILTMDQEGVVTTWSPGAERIFGYNPAEAAGQSFELIFTQEDRVAGIPQQELKTALDRGRADDDRWHLRKDGTRVYCSGITTPLVGGPSAGFGKICRNLTSEELLKQHNDAALATERATSNRLQEAGAMKDEFLAVVSHELKNPLSVVHMNAQLLARLPGLQSDQRGMHAVTAIRNAVKSQLEIINDLLDLSRANMGKVSLTPSLTELSALIRGIMEAVEPDIEAKAQALTAKLVPASVYADRTRVEQIIWNLVTNAIKFTPKGGTIHIDLEVESDMAHLSVADSGIGMDPQHLNDVFMMFRQIDTGTSRRTGGLGIGLALVKQLTELHGGRVQASSQGMGQGARFDVWLPLATGEQTGPPAVREDRVLQGLRVLIVDDEMDLLQAFGDLLRSEGADVALADDASKGLALALSERFDVVISDIAMPERDGHWLARQLRGNASGRDLTLIAVSGRAREVDRVRALEAGFDAHLGKPVDPELLGGTVRAALRQKSSKPA